MKLEETVDLGQGVNLEMVLIPEGTFLMGSTPIEDPFSNKKPRGARDEFPQHQVTLTKPFYMGKYEVTQEQWIEIMGKNPSDYKGKKVPVTCVSWNDCQEFIKKLNGITKGKYRLPTEAEWEYACRAWTKTVYSFGDVITPQDANYLDSNVGKPIEVGKYNPNAFGLYDMHGNVWEWCEDWYGEYPGGAITDPKGPAAGSWRVLRGGAFCNIASDARSSVRGNSFGPYSRVYVNGLRLVKTADVNDAVPATIIKPDPFL